MGDAMRFRSSTSDALGATAVVIFVVAILSTLPAWITHCATQISRLVDGTGDTFWNAVLLVVGAIFAPVGVIHGWLIWFGLA